MSLRFIADIMDVPYSTARRALFALNLHARKVGNMYILTETEAITLSEYLATRQEARQSRQGRH